MQSELITEDGDFALTYMEGPRYKQNERRTEGYDPREDFHIVEQTVFADRFAMADWLEDKLSTCDDFKHGMYCSPPHSFYIKSAVILTAFTQAELAQHKRLQACWQSYQSDPRSYFQNAPGPVYSLSVSLYEWVYGLL
jgi:hypothetical protein